MLLCGFGIIHAETQSVTNVVTYTVKTTTQFVPGSQIFIAGSYELQEQTVPAIHRYAMSNGYALTAWDDNHDNDSDAAIGRNRIALWKRSVTNVVSSKTNGTTITVTQTVSGDVIDLHLQGSESGMMATASKTGQPFLPLTASGKVPSDSFGTNGVKYVSSPACSLNSTSTITFGDVDQAVGRFNTAKSAPLKCVCLTEVAKLCALNNAFFAPTNFPVDNITSRQAQVLWSRGHLPLSFFTRRAADRTKGVFAAGLNLDSGARVLIQVECGIGSLSPVTQFSYDSLQNSLILTPGDTVDTIRFTAGNGGYCRPWDLCRAVEDSSSWSQTSAGQIKDSSGNPAVYPYSGPCYLISYAPVKEIVKVGGTKMLSYNGEAPWDGGVGYPGSFGTNGISSGSYSPWSVARLYKNTANAPKGTDKSLIDQMASAVASDILKRSTTDLGYGMTALRDLQVKRASEGATIFMK